MTRIIKRYGSRKLYDTSESRYVSLDELTALVRTGEEIHVLDNASGEDVTVMTLTQIISEEGRKDGRFLSSDLLHDLIRLGNTAVGERVKKLQSGVDRFVKHSLERIAPVTTVRDEVRLLRERLDELEATLGQAQSQVAEAPVAAEKPPVAKVKSSQSRLRKTPKAKPAAKTAAKETAKTSKSGPSRSRKTAVAKEGETAKREG